MTTLTGHAAIKYAEAHDLLLAKYADPTEDAREGVTAYRVPCSTMEQGSPEGHVWMGHT